MKGENFVLLGTWPGPGVSGLGCHQKICLKIDKKKFVSRF